MKRLLMIAYHFPPLAGSSGIQRTISFARHLPSFGWEPLILTAHPRAYERVSHDQLGDLPRARLSNARSLWIRRVISPSWAAIRVRRAAGPLGQLVARSRPERSRDDQDPPARCHLEHVSHCDGAPDRAHAPARIRPALGCRFSRSHGPGRLSADPRVWRSFKRIEESAVRHASFCVFAAPGAARLYRERYGDAAGAHLEVIENGYDEESFAPCDNALAEKGPLLPGTFTLVHSGIVYRASAIPRSCSAPFGRCSIAAL